MSQLDMNRIASEADDLAPLDVGDVANCDLGMDTKLNPPRTPSKGSLREQTNARSHSEPLESGFIQPSPSMDRIRTSILKCLFGPAAVSTETSAEVVVETDQADAMNSNVNNPPVISPELRNAIEDVIRQIQTRRPLPPPQSPNVSLPTPLEAEASGINTLRSAKEIRFAATTEMLSPTDQDEIVTTSGTLVALKPLALPRRGSNLSNTVNPQNVQQISHDLMSSYVNPATSPLATPQRAPSISDSHMPSVSGSFMMTAPLTRSASYASTISLAASVVENVLTPAFRIKTKQDLIDMANAEDERLLQFASQRDIAKPDTTSVGSPMLSRNAADGVCDAKLARVENAEDPDADIDNDCRADNEGLPSVYGSKMDREIEAEKQTRYRVTQDKTLVAITEVEEDNLYVRMHVRKDKLLRTLWEDLVRRYTSNPRSYSNSVATPGPKQLQRGKSINSPMTPRVASTPQPQLSAKSRTYSFAEVMDNDRPLSTTLGQAPTIAPKLIARDPSLMDPLPAPAETLELLQKPPQAPPTSPTHYSNVASCGANDLEKDLGDLWEVPRWLWNYPVRLTDEPFALPPNHYVRPAHHPEAFRPAPHVIHALRITPGGYGEDISEFDDDDALSVLTGVSNLSGGSVAASGTKRPRRKPGSTGTAPSAKTPNLRAIASSPGTRRRVASSVVPASANDEVDSISEAASVMSNVFPYHSGQHSVHEVPQSPAVTPASGKRRGRATGSASAPLQPLQPHQRSTPTVMNMMMNEGIMATGNEVFQAMMDTWVSMQSAAAALNAGGINASTLAGLQESQEFCDLGQAKDSMSMDGVNDGQSEPADIGYPMSPTSGLRRQPRRQATAKLIQTSEMPHVDQLATTTNSAEYGFETSLRQGFVPFPVGGPPLLSPHQLNMISPEAQQKVREAQLQHAKLVRMLNTYQGQLQNLQHPGTMSGSNSNTTTMDMSTMFANLASLDASHSSMMGSAGTSNPAASAPTQSTTRNTSQSSEGAPNLRLTLKIGHRLNPATTQSDVPRTQLDM